MDKKSNIAPVCFFMAIFKNIFFSIFPWLLRSFLYNFHTVPCRNAVDEHEPRHHERLLFPVRAIGNNLGKSSAQSAIMPELPE